MTGCKNAEPIRVGTRKHATMNPAPNTVGHSCGQSITMRSAPSAPAARFEVRHISISTRPDDLGSRSAAQDNSGAVAWSTFGYKQVVTLQSDFLAAWRGVRDALAYPAWIVGFSLFGVGSLARDAGLPAGASVLSTCLERFQRTLNRLRDSQFRIGFPEDGRSGAARII